MASQAWVAASGTVVKVGGTTLTAGYSIANGAITFTPASSNPAGLLQTAGTKSIAISKTGYNDATVTQTIGVGATNKIGIVTQPTAPGTNGGLLAQQPVANIQDQYGNVVTTSSLNINAVVSSGQTWTLGGTATIAAVNGVATFTNLTASNPGAYTGATIIFTGASLAPLTSNPFNIPAPPAAITLSSTNPAVAAGNITQNTTNNVLYAFQLVNDANTSSTNLTGLTITTAGTYTAANITNLKAWISTGSTFLSGSSTLMSTLSTPGVAGSKVFPSFTQQSIPAGATRYVYITGDFTCAVPANTISVNAVTTSNINFQLRNQNRHCLRWRGADLCSGCGGKCDRPGGKCCQCLIIC